MCAYLLDCEGFVAGSVLFGYDAPILSGMLGLSWAPRMRARRVGFAEFVVQPCWCVVVGDGASHAGNAGFVAGSAG